MYGRRPKPPGNCEHGWAKSSRFSGDRQNNTACLRNVSTAGALIAYDLKQT
jgi:hypothetical protein